MRKRSMVGLALLCAVAVTGCGANQTAQLSARPPAAADALARLGDLATPPPSTFTFPIPIPTPAIPAAAAAELAAEAANQGPPPPPPPGLGVGAQSPVVLTLEKKLEALHYFVGALDDSYDEDTRDAVMAFQKVTGMERTGRATDDVVAAIAAAKDGPAPLVAGGGFKRVEIDKDRQVLMLYETNNLSLILSVSSGSGERFCSEGWCRYAETPTGAFAIYDQRSGWERSALGWLYNSQYFNGGIAIHGSPSVPGYPASHGCIRIPMSAAEWFPDRIAVGTPVYVVAAGEPVPAPYVGPGGSAQSRASSVATTPPTTAPALATTTTVPNLLDVLFPAPTTAPRP